MLILPAILLQHYTPYILYNPRTKFYKAELSNIRCMKKMSKKKSLYLYKKVRYYNIYFYFSAVVEK